MKLNEQTKKTLTLIAIAVFVVVVGVWLILGTPDHIEDTNGPDDFSLQTITDENIINLDLGARGGPTVTHHSLLSGTVEFSAKKYTGVTEIFYDNMLLESDFWVDLSGFEVYEGNFKMVVVHDDEIVAVLEPGAIVECHLENVKGYVSLRIAGESASFSFTMSEFDFDSHASSFD